MNNDMQFLLYNMPDAEGSVQVVIRNETLWCTQKAMAQLFGVGVPAVIKHIKNIFEEGELSADSVVSKMEITAADGKNYETSYYTLDAISPSATVFHHSKPRGSANGLKPRRRRKMNTTFSTRLRASTLISIKK